MWAASVLTIFPEMFPGPLGLSLAGKALAGGLWSLEQIDIRDFATDRHRSVDDTPAGGGPGMVMKADVLARAIDAAGNGRPRLLMSPRGVPLTQTRVVELAAGAGLVVICGRFEGVDERVIGARGLEEVAAGGGGGGAWVLRVSGGVGGGAEGGGGRAPSLQEVSVGDYVLSGGEIAAM